MLSKDRIEDIELTLLLEAIFQKYKFDFRQYSKSSLKRNCHKAMTQFNLKSFSAIQEKVLNEDNFFQKLIQYITIPVTEMFRDPLYFAFIRKELVPHLKTYPSLKIWVAGCSTGEEAYSLAIILEEEELLDRTIIYATDINPLSLKKAQEGMYDISEIQKYTKNYQEAGGKKSLSDYYTVAYEAAAFSPRLKKRILFTDHSLATDNVFSEHQFISCRNVMIYFEKELQNRAVKLFYESLTSGGFLGLGEKETLRFSTLAPNFEVYSKPNSIYRKLNYSRMKKEPLL